MRAPRFVLVSAIVSIILGLGAAQAEATPIFQFSFTNNPSLGGVPGTVTGRILGLAEDGTGPASQVLIDSFPAGLNSIAGPTPIDATLWDGQDQNSFTTVAGQIVGGGFVARQTVNLNNQGFQLYINGSPYNFLNLDGIDALYVYGDDGFAAANITRLSDVASEVPEPATLSLLGVGLAGAAVRRYRKRK